MQSNLKTEFTLTHCNILQGSVHTNCPQGGDEGHGGETTINILMDGGAMEVDGIRKDTIQLKFYGDSEAITIQELLGEISKELKRQLELNQKHDKENRF